MNRTNIDRKQLRIWCISALVFWCALIAGFLYLLEKNEWQSAIFVGKEIGRSSLQKDYTYRVWSALHGGVYVPITDRTPPNPYLSHLPDRDVTTVHGKQLTLMNPAYMTRQVHELEQELYGIQGHITSLNLIRPANKPDEWEKNALQQFEQGVEEVTEFLTIENLPVVRVMLPMLTKELCLKCHADQGYKVGDIRGGISVTVPMTDVFAGSQKQIVRDRLYHLIIFLIGLTGLFVFYRQSSRQIIRRINTENKLLIQGDHLQGIVDNISNGIAVYNVHGNGDNFIVKSINPAGLKIAQLDLEDVVGKKVTEAFPGVVEMGLFAVFQRVWKTGKPEFFPFSTYKDERLSHWVENYVYKLPTGEVVAVYNDITDKKRLEEELFQAHKMEAIGTLAGGIAHDFNNILSAILGYAEIAKMELPDDSPVAKDIDQVIVAGKRATNLVKQILTFSRKTDQERKPLRLHLVVKEALQLIRASLPTTIDIQASIDQENDLVLADPTSMHQVVVNLCTNALYAIGNSKGKLEVTLERVFLEPGQIPATENIQAGSFIVLKITDTGKGMDKKTVARVFEPYFTTKKEGEGTGLGLAVTHSIVEECNGFIEVISAPGKGTTICIYLPAIDEEFASIIDGADALPMPMGTENILVVDDEPAVTGINELFLTNLGYNVTAEIKSMDALKRFEATPEAFDLVITDQTMPDLTGTELAKAMFKLKPDLPIILCTGYSSTISEAAAYDIGIKGFASKPLDQRKLADIVRRVLDENSKS